MQNASEELVDIVDHDDNVLYQCTRKEMRTQVLHHRAVFIAVINSAGELLIHLRSEMKDLWPSWWDIAVGGVVSAGESYDAAALRELDEEVGITGVPLVELGVGTYSDEEVSLVGKCFLARYDGPLILRDGEVVATEWVSQKDLLQHLAERNFLPDSKALVLPALQKILK
ncbi:MAG: NUDIX domain-containing protein [Actinomycetes bacterium]